MSETTRLMRVYEAPGTGWRSTAQPKPEIRLSNRLLIASGFEVGTRIAVRYGTNAITITKLSKDTNYEH